MTHKLTLMSSEPVTHDTTRLRFGKPPGFDFTPGQAVHLNLDREGWHDEKRPFSMTSLPEWDELEFIIKSYPEHEGVTAQIPTLRPGEQVTIDDPFGAIEDKGPGVFIAGGAGITPFISVLRARLARKGDLSGSTLIFSNSEARDIILRDEWVNMPGLTAIFTLTGEDHETYSRARVDAPFLESHLNGWREVFYVCGPPPMEDSVLGTLEAKGVPRHKMVTDHWG